MPVVKVSGGFKIRGSAGGRPKLIGTGNGKPFKSRAAAERVSGMRESFKKGK